MKRYLRLCLVCLLSLALPLSGMAAVQMPADPCPMQAAGSAMSDAMLPDCCQDMGSASESGKSCKPGQECKTASLLQVSLIKAAALASSPLSISFSSAFMPAQAPSGVWRPPRI